MIFSATLIPYLKPLSIVRSVISEYLGHFLSVSLDETWYGDPSAVKQICAKRRQGVDCSTHKFMMLVNRSCTARKG